jgi:hypothetical protein
MTKSDYLKLVAAVFASSLAATLVMLIAVKPTGACDVLDGRGAEVLPPQRRSS